MLPEISRGHFWPLEVTWIFMLGSPRLSGNERSSPETPTSHFGPGRVSGIQGPRGLSQGHPASFGLKLLRLSFKGLGLKLQASGFKASGLETSQAFMPKHPLKKVVCHSFFFFKPYLFRASQGLSKGLQAHPGFMQELWCAAQASP